MSLVSPDGTPVVSDSDPRKRLPKAFGEFVQAAKVGNRPAAIDAADRSLQAIAEIHRVSYPDFHPTRGVDYEVEDTEQGINLRDITPAGSVLCTLWQTYGAQVESTMLREQVLALTHAVNAQGERIEAQQRQLDNAMMDFDKIKRKIRA